MAKPKSKVKEVAKFGGVDSLGSIREIGNTKEFKGDLSSDKFVGVDNVAWDANSVEAQSKTNLENDRGEGEAIVIRCFTFGMNPQTFIEQRPSKQDLFNAHLSGIEMGLYADGLRVFDQVPPRLIFDVEKKQYSIFVAARPRKGYALQERPQTLTEIAHG